MYKFILILISIVILQQKVNADWPATIDGHRIFDNSIPTTKIEKSGTNEAVIFDTIEVQHLFVTDIHGVTIEVDLTDYTRRDGTQGPTDNWDFDAKSITNINAIEATSIKADTIEIGATSAYIWYDALGNMWFRDDFITINLSEIEEAFNTKVDKVPTAIEDNITVFDAAGGLKDSLKSLSDYYTTDEIDTKLAAQDSASELINDSGVSGSMISDALDNLFTIATNPGSVYTTMSMKCDKVKSVTADVILTDTDADALQDAIDMLSEGEVLEIKTNVTYNPITISTNNIIIKAAIGYCPKITGLYGITLSDGLHDVIIEGIIMDSCGTANSNYMGACVTFGTQGSKVQDILFSNMTFANITSGSAVMLSYHGFTDSYAANILDSDCSERIAFIDCCFNKAGLEATEGAAISLRAVKYLYFYHNKIDGLHVTSRGIQLQGVQNAFIYYNRIENMMGNGEAIKIDEIGTAQFVNTAIIQKNYIREAIQGIDIDDVCAAIVYANKVWDVTNEAIVLDDSSQGRFICNCTFNSSVGIHLELGSSAEVKNNVSFNNTNNYLIENGYVIDGSNSEDIRDTILGQTANNTAYDNTSYNNVDKALDYLFSSTSTYLQTIEVWVSDDSGSYTLSNIPDGQVTVIYENAVWQTPYVNYTVSGNIVNIIGGTTTGKNYMFSYIYH